MKEALKEETAEMERVDGVEEVETVIKMAGGGRRTWGRVGRVGRGMWVCEDSRGSCRLLAICCAPMKQHVRCIQYCLPHPGLELDNGLKALGRGLQVCCPCRCARSNTALGLETGVADVKDWVLPGLHSQRPAPFVFWSNSCFAYTESERQGKVCQWGQCWSALIQEGVQCFLKCDGRRCQRHKRRRCNWRSVPHACGRPSSFALTIEGAAFGMDSKGPSCNRGRVRRAPVRQAAAACGHPLLSLLFHQASTLS